MKINEARERASVWENIGGMFRLCSPVRMGCPAEKDIPLYRRAAVLAGGEPVYEINGESVPDGEYYDFSQVIPSRLELVCPDAHWSQDYVRFYRATWRTSEGTFSVRSEFMKNSSLENTHTLWDESE